MTPREVAEQYMTDAKGRFSHAARAAMHGDPEASQLAKAAMEEFDRAKTAMEAFDSGSGQPR